ncbi:MAG: ABC transporter permease subunit, partial [Planctomycetaceae bacterium]
MLSNPIIRREFIGLMRSTSFHCTLAAVAFVSIVLVMIRWPTDGLVDRSGDRARDVFTVLAFGLTALVILLVPVNPATSIVTEKRKGTLALLLNSNLSGPAIYSGKLIGALTAVLFLLLVSTPAVTACVTMGGISLTSHILPFYLILGAACLQYSTLGLLVSTLTNSTDSALRTTYGGVLCLSVLALAPNYFLQGFEGVLADFSVQLQSLSPLPAIMEIVGLGTIGTQGLVVESGKVTRFLMASLLTSAVFTAATLRRLNWRILDQSRSQGIITDDRSLGVRIARRLFFLVDPQRRKTGIWWFMNPVMIKEFRCRQFGRFHWLMRIVAGCAIVSLALACATTMGSEEWGVETIGTIVVILQIALVLLLTPGLAAGLISTERESGGWDLLRVTPLSTGSILRGKLMSVFWTLLLILAATLPGYWVMIWI